MPFNGGIDCSLAARLSEFPPAYVIRNTPRSHNFRLETWRNFKNPEFAVQVKAVHSAVLLFFLLACLVFVLLSYMYPCLPGQMLWCCFHVQTTVFCYQLVCANSANDRVEVSLLFIELAAAMLLQMERTICLSRSWPGGLLFEVLTREKGEYWGCWCITTQFSGSHRNRTWEFADHVLISGKLFPKNIRLWKSCKLPKENSWLNISQSSKKVFKKKQKKKNGGQSLSEVKMGEDPPFCEMIRKQFFLGSFPFVRSRSPPGCSQSCAARWGPLVVWSNPCGEISWCLTTMCAELKVCVDRNLLLGVGGHVGGSLKWRYGAGWVSHCTFMVRTTVCCCL